MIENIISDTGNESLQEIIEKILSPEDLNKKFMVYSMFKITRGRDPILIKNINLWLQLQDDELWKKIQKAYYPTLFDKIKSFFRS